MPNLSQIKRQRMMDFLAQIKEEHKDDDAMLIALGEIESELNAKKYGLVWEEHEEAVDVKMRTHIPVFTEDASKEITCDTGGIYNFLLEGDNLHSLRLLEKTHAGKIDVIYIDPPYNTGSKDFIYDDAYVDSTDGFKHSKWLSFIEKRLRLAYELLSSEGVIYISISDIELYNLRLLCDEIFGEINFVANLVWTNKEGGGSSDSKLFRIKQEYILVYAKSIDAIQIKGVPVSNEDRYKSEDEYVATRGKYYLQKLGMGSIQYSVSLDYPIKTPDGSFVMPKDNNNGKKACWRWSQAKFEWGCENGFVEMKKDRKGVWTIYTKQYLNCDNDGNLIERTQRPMGVIDSFSSTQGAKQLKQILPDSPFSYPKDTNLIAWIIDRMPKKDITILDFFAGSGTTAQAVLEQNGLDSGSRKFIICTNNENGICDNATYPRLKSVITGNRPDGSKYSDGIPANLKYYRTDFVSKDEEYLSDALLEHIAEMIQLEHGVKLDGQNYIMVLDDDEADDLASHWSDHPDAKALYVSKNVLFTTEQNALFKDVEVHIIPDYYFNFELREVGETW